MIFTNSTLSLVEREIIKQTMKAKEQISIQRVISMEQNRRILTLNIPKTSSKLIRSNITTHTTNETLTVVTKQKVNSKPVINLAGQKLRKNTIPGCLEVLLSNTIRAISKTIRIGTNSKTIGTRFRLMLRGRQKEKPSTRNTRQMSRAISTLIIAATPKKT